MSTAIEWTDETWNPVTGCTPISAGCLNCYAQRMAKRLKAMGQHRYRNGFQVTCHGDLLDAPFRWRKPRRVFVCSMGDLFHDDVPMNFILQVYDYIHWSSRHTFQILTKRPDGFHDLARSYKLASHVWCGVTVEAAGVKHRINALADLPTPNRFLSCEPLLEPLGNLWLARKGIAWVIVGGETGPGARPMKREWVESIREQCRAAKVPFFFKQWGGVNKKKAGRLLNGRTYDAMPGRIIQ